MLILPLSYYQAATAPVTICEPIAKNRSSAYWTPALAFLPPSSWTDTPCNRRARLIKSLSRLVYVRLRPGYEMPGIVSCTLRTHLETDGKRTVNNLGGRCLPFGEIVIKGYAYGSKGLFLNR